MSRGRECQGEGTVKGKGALRGRWCGEMGAGKGFVKRGSRGTKRGTSSKGERSLIRGTEDKEN